MKGTFFNNSRIRSWRSFRKVSSFTLALIIIASQFWFLVGPKVVLADPLTPDLLPTGIVADEDITPKTLKVKFTSEVADDIYNEIGNGGSSLTSFGSNALDEIDSFAELNSVTRIYPYASSFESDHRDYELHQYFMVTYNEEVSESFVRAQLLADSDVLDVQYVPIITSPEIIDPKYEPEDGMGAFYDDTYYPLQWGLENTGFQFPGAVADADVDFEAAMSIETGDPSVAIGFVDTGVNIAHPDLAANIFVNTGEIPANSIDDDGNGYVDDVNGWDFDGNDNNPYPDTDGHGTFTAGNAIAVGDNGIGVASIAGGTAANPGVKGLPIRGFGSMYSGAAMVYAGDLGVKLLTVTFSIEPAKEALNYYMNHKGGVVLYSAGNSNTTVCGNCPGYYNQEVFAIAAINYLNERATFSNYGDWIDVTAPGAVLWTTEGADTYRRVSGTSFSTPVTAAVMALILSYNNNLSGIAARHIVEHTADDSIYGAGFDIYSGWGIANANNALSFLQSPDQAFVANKTIEYFEVGTPELPEGKDLYITNVTGSPITVDLVSANANFDLPDDEYTIPAYETEIVNVLFDPTTFGSYTGSINIDDGTDSLDVPLKATYIGGFEDITAAEFDPLSDQGSVNWGDYDNDGDMDLIMTAQNSSSGDYETQIYKNNANDTFTKQTTTYPGVIYATVKWGDYDNDSDLDFVLSGYDVDNSQNILKIYNNNSGTFTAVSTTLPQIRSISLKWVDYDNDGDLDLIGGGYNTSDAATFKILRNEGSNTFTDTSHSITSVVEESVAFADIEKDGDLDMYITGYTSTPTAPVAKLYTNSGGTYTVSGTSFTGMSSGDAVFADYDGDGDFDIIQRGILAFGYENTGLYRNNGSGVYSSYTINLNQSNINDILFADYDNDGDIDMAAVAKDTALQTFTSGTFLVSDYFNDPQAFEPTGEFVDYNNDGKIDFFQSSKDETSLYKNNIGNANSNNAPGKPTALTDSTSGGYLTMSWTAPTDDHTATNRLTYNVRVSTVPNGEGVKGSMSLANGTRKIVQVGNAGTKTSYTIAIPSGASNLFWEVQAIDEAYKGGEFEKFVPLAVTLESFTVTQTGDINMDLDWETASEINNLGFDVYRSLTVNGTKTKLNSTLIDSESPGSGQGAMYNFESIDGLYMIDQPYYFWLESVDLWGNRQMYGPYTQ